MCGIAGFFQPFYNLNLQPDTVSKLNAMKDSLYHRGPDDGNIYYGTHGALAHRRLSIIDIQGGAQPMQQSCSGSHSHPPSAIVHAGLRGVGSIFRHAAGQSCKAQHLRKAAGSIASGGAKPSLRIVGDQFRAQQDPVYAEKQYALDMQRDKLYADAEQM